MAEVGGASGSGEPRCAPPPRSPPTQARPAEREQDPAETEAPETAATGAAVDGWAEDEPAAAVEHSLPPLGGPNVDQGDEGGRGAGGSERGGDEDRDSDGRFYRSVVEQHYARLGYRVHSGLQFGTDFVLYRDDPSLVHSEYCVRVVPPGGTVDWRSVQILARSMPALHKSLVLAAVVRAPDRVDKQEEGTERAVGEDGCRSGGDGAKYHVKEVLVTSEHAPFRQKSLERRKRQGSAAAAAAATKPKKKGGAKSPASAAAAAASDADPPSPPPSPASDGSSGVGSSIALGQDGGDRSRKNEDPGPC